MRLQQKHRASRVCTRGWICPGGLRKAREPKKTGNRETRLKRLNFRESANTSALKPAGNWNRLMIAVKGQSFQARINGQLVQTANWAVVPEKVGLALDPHGQMDFCNLFVRELK